MEEERGAGDGHGKWGRGRGGGCKGVKCWEHDDCDGDGHEEREREGWEREEKK